MKLKVCLSCVVDLDGIDNIRPIKEIGQNIIEDPSIWDEIGVGYPVYNKKCFVREVDDSND
jgi:hypothetical protein